MDKVQADIDISSSFYPFGAATSRARLGGPLPPHRGQQVSASGLVAVADRLGRSIRLVDEAGFEHAIVAGAVHPMHGWPAWIECRCRLPEDVGGHVEVAFTLEVRIDGQEPVRWPLPCYNPYFGCRVGHMAWHGEQVVTIYREKHSTYVCTFASGSEPRFVQMAGRWRLAGEVVELARWRTKEVERWSLPELHSLAPLTGTEAQATGLLWGAR